VASSSQQIKYLKWLIWLYLVLLVTEGALRKWVVPSLATPLLIVRDPLVVVIYLVASSCRKFVFNGYVMASFMLAAASFAGSLLAPETNIYITMIGLRCYFLHLPLIFVLEKTLDTEDIERIGKFFLWFAIPETLLCVTQFDSPQTHWSNYSVGGQITMGMSGALNKFRPSGTFSFTTGVAEFYPLALAALLGFVMTRKKLPWHLSLVAGLCIAVAVPVSISRTNAVTCGLVLLVAGASAFALPGTPKIIMRTVLFIGLATVLASWLPHFDEGVDAFSSRWTGATGNTAQSFQTNIVGRFFSDLLPPIGLLFDTPLLGQGVGRGTMMAQGFLFGQRQFALGEAEWPRLILELGPVLGLAFILLRVSLCARVASQAFQALRRDNIWPVLFSIPAVLLVLNAQWGQPTTLGFATFAAGLSFAATRMHLTSTPAAPVSRRHRYGRRPTWQQPLYEPLARPAGRRGSANPFP
jgi:hypothetical protein